jgi:hypothetical protein
MYITNTNGSDDLKAIISLSLVKSMMITCDLLVYFPTLIKHKYIKFHRKNELIIKTIIASIVRIINVFELKFQKILPNHLNGILSNHLRGDYKMKCIEIKNHNKTLDFSIASTIDYVKLNLINCKRMILNQKGEDMQSTSKFLAYLRHNDVNRGDYIT